jgi:hypothetical protein
VNRRLWAMLSMPLVIPVVLLVGNMASSCCAPSPPPHEELVCVHATPEHGCDWLVNARLLDAGFFQRISLPPPEGVPHP